MEVSERGLTVLLVAALDRRVLPALTLVPMLSGADALALHIAVDREASWRLGRDWMELGVTWLPLHIEEPTSPDVVQSVYDFMAREVGVRPWVTVVIPELDLGRWWQPLVHRATGRSVAWALHDLPRVTTVVVPVRVDLNAGAVLPKVAAGEG